MPTHPTNRPRSVLATVLASLLVGLLVLVPAADAAKTGKHGNTAHKVGKPRITEVFLVPIPPPVPGLVFAKTALCVQGKFDIARVSIDGKHVVAPLVDSHDWATGPDFGASRGCPGYYGLLVPINPDQPCYQVRIKASRGEKKYKRTRYFNRQVCLSVKPFGTADH